MSDKLKERNILKLISIVRFACATLDVGHPITGGRLSKATPSGIECSRHSAFQALGKRTAS
jgi:hypothetical protein